MGDVSQFPKRGRDDLAKARATVSRVHIPRHVENFERQGDYAALDDAFAFLDLHGFSAAKPQGANPIGFMLGDETVPSWKQLSLEQANDMHGWITSGDFRNGPVTIAIRDDVHSSVVEAFTAEIPTPGEAADAHDVIDPPGAFLDDRPSYVRLTEDQDRTAQDAVEGGRE